MQLRTVFRSLLMVVTMLVTGAGISYSQAVYGNIFGTVTDSTGAAVVKARVTITDVSKGTSMETVTNESGNYRVEHLIPDDYNIRIEAPGFKKIENKGVHVSADTSIRVDGVFQVGATSEVVEVTSEAPLLKLDRADVATLLDETTTTQLPVLNRNFTSLELLSPGAVFQSGWQHASTENPQGSQQIFINGLKFGGTSWQLDGTDNKDPVLGIIVINPTLESVSEIKMTTQNYDAEFGNATSGVITAQTKSGGNALHGGAFYYGRTDATQARDPFAQSEPDPVTGKYIPTNQYNQFGASIGGPVIKDKLFYFGDYQGTRRNVGTSWITTVPTANVRATCLAGTGFCDLSEYGIPIYDPASSNSITGVGRTEFANAQIPVQQLNSAALTMLKNLPAPTRPGLNNNYTGSGTSPFNDDDFNVRGDYQLKPNFHIFGRYSYVRFTQSSEGGYGVLGGPGFLSGNGTGNDLSRDDSIAAGFDSAVNANLATDFRFGFFRYHIYNQKFDAANAEAASNLGLPGLNVTTYPGTSGLPTFDFSDSAGGVALSSFGDINCNCPLNENEKQIQFVNNWTRTYKNHTFKFGADLRYAMNLRDASDDNRTGHFTFNSYDTASDTGGGLSLASFLLGDATTFARYVIANSNAGEHQKRFFVYAQDTWRVTPKITLSLGVRWEDIFPETASTAGEGGLIDLGSGYIKVAGVGGIPTNGGQSNTWNYFSPRLGVAYQFTPKTVIRVGFGESYDEGIFGLVFGTAMTHNIPVIADQTLAADDPHTAAFNISTGPVAYVFPSVPSSGLIPLQNDTSYPSVRPPKMKLVAVDAYNISVQHQITPSTSVEAAYVGNYGVHVTAGDAGYNVNQAVVGPGTLHSREPLFNKFVNGANVCCDQGIALVSPDAHSVYNSLQTRVDRRMANGLQVSAFYTYSKGFDHLDDYFNNDPHVQRGPVDFNRNNVFTTSVVYQLPFGRGRLIGQNVSRVANYVIGGWQLSTITGFASGLPFTFGYQNSGADVDSGPGRPDKIGYFPMTAGKLDPVGHLVHYFTPVATMTANGMQSGPFRRPQQYTFGNSGRNGATGPGMFTSDMSLMKNFAFTERVNAEFKMDAFNVFNHPVLGTPNSCVDCSLSAGAGEITGLQGYTSMRNLQFGARFTF